MSTTPRPNTALALDEKRYAPFRVHAPHRLRHVRLCVGLRRVLPFSLGRAAPQRTENETMTTSTSSFLSDADGTRVVTYTWSDVDDQPAGACLKCMEDFSAA